MYESKTRTVLEFYVSMFYAQSFIYRLLHWLFYARKVSKKNFVSMHVQKIDSGNPRLKTPGSVKTPL